jgi:hypothetical protein
MVHPTDNRATADVSCPAGAVAAPVDMAGVYLTDEVFLFRVVGSLANAVDEVVELEDCYCLDVVTVPVSHLHSRRLRVVTPAIEG